MTDSGTGSTPRRLRILTDEEIEALYSRPSLSADERADYFTLTSVEQELLRSVRGLSPQIAFLLQLGYFKAKQLFFPLDVEESAADVAYLRARYFPDSAHVDLQPLNKRTVLRQHHLLQPAADLTEIVRLYGLRNWVEKHQPHCPHRTDSSWVGTWFGLLSLLILPCGGRRDQRRGGRPAMPCFVAQRSLAVLA